MRVLLGTTVLCLSPALAMAADLPVRTAAPPPVFAAAPPTWNGFYFGGHLGYGWGSFDVDDGRPRKVPLDNSGIVVGVHAGYNYQVGMLVFGLEGDLSAAPWKKTTSNGLGPVYEFRTRWMGSFRGRVGVAFDNFLIYGTAGVGAVDSTASASLNGRSQGSIDFYKIGVVAGGGVEYKLTQNIVVGVEGLYFFVNGNNRNGGKNFGTSISSSFIGGRAGDVGVVRARLSFLW